MSIIDLALLLLGLWAGYFATAHWIVSGGQPA